ncbi:DUF5999 family protein [Streptomyces albus]
MCQSRESHRASFRTDTPSRTRVSGDCSRLHSIPSGEVQRRSLLCNGVLLFEDTGGLLPDGRITAPRKPTAPQRQPAGRRVSRTSTLC